MVRLSTVSYHLPTIIDNMFSKDMLNRYKTFLKKERTGELVSLLAYYSDGPSLKPAFM